MAGLMEKMGGKAGFEKPIVDPLGKAWIGRRIGLVSLPSLFRERAGDWGS